MNEIMFLPSVILSSFVLILLFCIGIIFLNLGYTTSINFPINFFNFAAMSDTHGLLKKGEELTFIVCLLHAKPPY